MSFCGALRPDVAYWPKADIQTSTRHNALGLWGRDNEGINPRLAPLFRTGVRIASLAHRILNEDLRVGDGPCFCSQPVGHGPSA
jgi:hypothetical protein